MAGSVTDIRVATHDDASEVGRIFGAGFEDDPVLSWVFRDPGRGEKLRDMFSFLVAELFVPTGSTWVMDGAAAAWQPPSPPPADDAFLTGMAAALEVRATPEDIERLLLMGAAMDEAHPTEPHWYLGVIATEPDRRAQGMGGALLTESLQVVDADRSPAYLESSNPRNITLYERHGFVVTREIPIGDGPSMTAMWRAAR
jgi:ribosomal protein S18 acetylase RimI-like enzyme